MFAEIMVNDNIPVFFVVRLVFWTAFVLFRFWDLINSWRCAQGEIGYLSIDEDRAIVCAKLFYDFEVEP